MRFTKMQGIGNDYIYVSCFREKVVNPRELAVKISDRHFGVGGDGLVLIMPSIVADARMRIFNADGSEAEMCGNGIRCVGKYLYDHGILKKELLTVETLAGIKQLTLNIENNLVKSVRVDMGEPILESKLVPVACEEKSALNLPLKVNGRDYHFTAVSMGNPHCVIFTPEITAKMVLEDGPAIEINPLFPRRTNVEFVQVKSTNELIMRVWERGSGETMACGTGACAVLVAATLNGYVNATANIYLTGGELKVEWDRNSNHVFMTGPAIEVFEGEWLL